MSTALIEIENDYAENILHNLAQLNVIRIIKHNKTTSKTKQKLSERFAGCLSKTRAEELQQELTKMRNEWERDIY